MQQLIWKRNSVRMKNRIQEMRKNRNKKAAITTESPDSFNTESGMETDDDKEVNESVIQEDSDVELKRKGSLSPRSRTNDFFVEVDFNNGKTYKKNRVLKD